jgi:hypothetical protein
VQRQAAQLARCVGRAQVQHSKFAETLKVCESVVLVLWLVCTDVSTPTTLGSIHSLNAWCQDSGSTDLPVACTCDKWR